MDPSLPTSMVVQELNRQHRHIHEKCLQRKPILKSGNAGSAVYSSLFDLYRIFFDNAFEIMSEMVRQYRSGEDEHQRAFLCALECISLGVNSMMRSINDSLSPLSRRSDEFSVELIHLLHQDTCNLSVYTAQRVADPLKTLSSEIEVSTNRDGIIHQALLNVLFLVDEEVSRVFPSQIVNIEKVVYSRVASSVQSLIATECQKDYFLVKSTNDSHQLGERIEVKCLRPILKSIEKGEDPTSLQRLVSITVRSVMVSCIQAFLSFFNLSVFDDIVQDTILKEIVRNSFKFNEKGVNLLFGQLNHLCAWVGKVKADNGFMDRKPFLIDKSSLLDATYIIGFLHSAAVRDRDRALCGSCFPVLKYNFANVVAPDSDGTFEEGKSSSESMGNLTPRMKKLNVKLNGLVVSKTESIWSKFNLGNPTSDAKICCALTLNSDTL